MKTSYPRLRRVLWKTEWIDDVPEWMVQRAVEMAHAEIGRARTGWVHGQMITRPVGNRYVARRNR